MNEKEKALLIEILGDLVLEIESTDGGKWAYERFDPIRRKIHTLEESFEKKAVAA
jgi:hypothetical protein